MTRNAFVTHTKDLVAVTSVTQLWFVKGYVERKNEKPTNKR